MVLVETLSSFPLSAIQPGLSNTLIGGDAPNARYSLSQIQSALAPGAWTAYTPSVVATVGAFTTVSAVGAYSKIGRVVAVRIVVTITNAGTASAWYVTLPFPSTDNAVFYGTGSEDNVALTGIARSSVNGVQNVTVFRYDGTVDVIPQVYVLGGVYESTT